MRARIFPLLVVLSSAMLLSACGGGNRQRRNNPPPPPPPRNEMAQERRDDVNDARIEDRTGWDKLGERMVDGKVDRDTIGVTRAEGRFTRVMVVVEHSALEMYDVDITFGDGEHFSPGTRYIFGKDTRSRVIDLPGGARVIRKVEFRYGNLPGGGRAQIELWAK